MIASLGYIGVGGDTSAWKTYAAEVLGAEISGGNDGDVLALRFDELEARMWVHPGEPEDLLYIGWEVATEVELDGLITRLEKEGISVQEGTSQQAEERSVARLVKYTSPDGFETELFFGPAAKTERPFSSPTGISKFVTGGLGLGHIGLSVPDIETATRYYTEILGFRISDYIDFNFGPEPSRVAFLHCNPRHHTLALVPVEMPKRLHHLMVEVGSLDDVGSAYQVVQEREIPIIGELGRHTNDQIVSFYMASPSGFAIEYGWGGLLIDDQDWSIEVYDSASLWGHQGLG